VGFGKAAIPLSGTEEDLLSFDENGPGTKVQGEGSVEANSQYRGIAVIATLLSVPAPAPLELNTRTAPVMKYPWLKCPVRVVCNVLPLQTHKF
jgi:hypothetical protein